jgi:hypothetical protein
MLAKSFPQTISVIINPLSDFHCSHPKTQVIQNKWFIHLVGARFSSRGELIFIGKSNYVIENKSRAMFVGVKRNYIYENKRDTHYHAILMKMQ